MRSTESRSIDDRFFTPHTFTSALFHFQPNILLQCTPVRKRNFAEVVTKVVLPSDSHNLIPTKKMTSKAAAASFIIFSLVALTSGFSTSLTPLAVNNEAKILSRLYMSTESEVDRLRAAAAKAREEYEALASKNGKTVTSRTSNTLTAPSRKDMSVDEIRKIASSIDFANGDASSQSMALDNLVDTGEFGLWKSAVRRGPTSSTSAMS